MNVCYIRHCCRSVSGNSEALLLLVGQSGGKSEALLLLVGQPGGSLQAVKQSLLHMRFPHDHTCVSSTSVVANASMSVRSLPTQTAQPEDSSRVICIAGELIRYVLDDKDLSSVVGDKTSSCDEAVTSSDPCIMSIALRHQQLRAEVLTTPMAMNVVLVLVILGVVVIRFSIP